MVISKAKVPSKCSIFINGKEVKQVESFSHLGSLITSDGKSEHDIKQRIGKAKTVLWQYEECATESQNQPDHKTMCFTLLCLVSSVVRM